jgi:hypothetical protein
MTSLDVRFWPSAAQSAFGVKQTSHFGSKRLALDYALASITALTAIGCH